MDNNKINEKYLLTLTKDSKTGLIEICEEEIINPLENQITELIKIWPEDFDDEYDNLIKLIDKTLKNNKNIIISILKNLSFLIKNIINFLRTTPEIKYLNNYNNRYCESYQRPFQEFNVNTDNLILEIEEKYKLNLKLIQEIELMDDNLIFNDLLFDKIVISFFKMLKSNFITWSNAVSINETYKLCFKDKSVLAFSHRIRGWANPKFNITENLSVDIKTNFGYGKSSYFLLVINFKNLDIIPFAEWIEYKFINKNDILFYTKKFKLVNTEWYECMKFVKYSCNLSIEDEKKFIDTYLNKKTLNLKKKKTIKNI